MSSQAEIHVPDTTPLSALRRAHVTLQSGCAFLLHHVGGASYAPVDTGSAAYARLTGNRLRELDRFLSVLLDEIARLRGGPGHDAAGFARRKNTAGKLRIVEAMTGAQGSAGPRLRAIGRLSACLHHCSGVRHAPGLHDDLLVAVERIAADAGTRNPLDRLFLADDNVRAICRFYRDLGDALMRDLPAVPARAAYRPGGSGNSSSASSRRSISSPS